MGSRVVKSNVGVRVLCELGFAENDRRVGSGLVESWPRQLAPHLWISAARWIDLVLIVSCIAATTRVTMPVDRAITSVACQEHSTDQRSRKAPTREDVVRIEAVVLVLPTAQLAVSGDRCINRIGGSSGTEGTALHDSTHRETTAES